MTVKPEALNLRSEKIQAIHLERLAVVYVRQSTLQQVLEHQESTRLQYGLVDRAYQSDSETLLRDQMNLSQMEQNEFESWLYSYNPAISD